MKWNWNLKLEVLPYISTTSTTTRQEWLNPNPARANWVSIWDLELWNQLLFHILSYHPFGSWHNQLWNKNTLNQIIFTPAVAALVTLSLSSLVLPYSRSACVKYGSCMVSFALIRKSFIRWLSCFYVLLHLCQVLQKPQLVLMIDFRELNTPFWLHSS